MDIEKTLSQLSIEEKAGLCMGADSWSTRSVERLGLPAVRTCDGPHGLRKQEPKGGNIGISDSQKATCFPPASLASSSFDRDLIRRMGEAIAEEAILQGIDVVLGPAVNIKRSPLCGRNFEYVCEDPYLAGEYATAYIQGLQGKGVGASLKHFAVNNQETLRLTVDSVVDERALREIYLAAFEKAVRQAQPYTVMASYNLINGVYGCENEHTIKELLRGEWGFRGLVVSDWGAINDRVAALRAGCDLEMPESGPSRSEEIVAAVKSGSLDEAVLDEAVRHILALAERCSARPKVQVTTDAKAVYAAHDRLAREIAAKSMVLLKNEGGTLPLKRDKRYAILGAFADKPRYQGGGSSHISPTRLSSFKASLESSGVAFEYSPGYSVEADAADEGLIAEAAACASRADAALVFVGLTDIYEYEGLDRKTLCIPPAHIRLIEAAAAANPNLVVVLCAGSAVETAWAGKCRALLYAGVMGQAGGDAICDILFGAANPSGRLTETFPLSLEDVPCRSCFPGGSGSVHYRESIYVGYRYYSTAKVAVAFPFGFGLSYTSFEHAPLSLVGASGSEGKPLAEGESLSVETKAKNTGKIAGADVLQLYVRNCSTNSFNSSIVLKEFAKVELKPGEEKKISFELPYSAFERYDSRDGWVADPGEYEVFAAESSADLGPGLRAQVGGKGRPIEKAGLDAYFRPAPGAFDGGARAEASFERLYGRKPAPLDAPKKDIDLNTPLSRCRGTLVGNLLYFVARIVITKTNSGPEARAAREALIGGLGDTPIRSMVVMNAGTDLRTGKGLVKMMNGHFFSGLRETLSSLK